MESPTSKTGNDEQAASNHLGRGATYKVPSLLHMSDGQIDLLPKGHCLHGVVSIIGSPQNGGVLLDLSVAL